MPRPGTSDVIVFYPISDPPNLMEEILTRAAFILDPTSVIRDLILPVSELNEMRESAERARRAERSIPTALDRIINNTDRESALRRLAEIRKLAEKNPPASIPRERELIPNPLRLFPEEPRPPLPPIITVIIPQPEPQRFPQGPSQQEGQQPRRNRRSSLDLDPGSLNRPPRRPLLRADAVDDVV